MTPLREQVTEPAPPTATNDDAGAVAFAQYYVDLQNWAVAAPDPAALDAACLPENAQCQRIRATAELLIENSWAQYDGKSLLALGTELVVSRPGADRAIVQTLLVVPALEVRDAVEFTVAYHLVWTGTGWMAADAVRVEG